MGSSEPVLGWIVDGILYPGSLSSFTPEIYSLSTGASGFTTVLERGRGSYWEALSIMVGSRQWHMSRWRSFEFICTERFWQRESSLPTILPEGIKIYPSLKAFKLQLLDGKMWYAGRHWKCPAVVVVDTNKPDEKRLEEFTLYDIKIVGFDISSLNPLPLRRLTLHPCDYAEFRFILRCHNLEYLSVGFCDTCDSLEAEPVSFTSLSTLRLASNGYLPKSFFQLISVPFLQRLIIHTHRYGRPRFLRSYLNKNLFPALKQLDLRWEEQHGMEDQNIVEFAFSNAPVLETIAVDKENLQPFLRLVAQTSSEGIEPRRVRRLLVTEAHIRDVSKTTIVETLNFTNGSHFVSYCYLCIEPKPNCD
jgi:hypothetical protein